MAYALSHPVAGLPGAAKAAKKPGLPLWKRVINAIVLSRIASVERELRARAALLGDTHPVLGEYRKISFNRADILPFTE